LFDNLTIALPQTGILMRMKSHLLPQDLMAKVNIEFYPTPNASFGGFNKPITMKLRVPRWTTSNATISITNAGIRSITCDKFFGPMPGSVCTIARNFSIGKSPLCTIIAQASNSSYIQLFKPFLS
jgi:hypothetical protein